MNSVANQGGVRRAVFVDECANAFFGRHDIRDPSDSVAAAPDVAPGIPRVPRGTHVHLFVQIAHEMFRVEPRALDRIREEVCRHAAEIIRGDDVCARRAGNEILVFAERERAIPPGADFLDERKGRHLPGMSARARSDGDETIATIFDGLARVTVGDDVVEDEAAVAVHGVDDVAVGRQADDDDWYLVLDDGRGVLHQAVVRRVRDLVDRERCGGLCGIGAVVIRERALDRNDPFAELLLRTRVQGRHGADDAGPALGDDELGTRDDEHRRTDDRAGEVVEDRWQGHRCRPAKSRDLSADSAPAATRHSRASGNPVRQDLRFAWPDFRLGPRFRRDDESRVASSGLRHSRAGGNPVRQEPRIARRTFRLGPRFRGDDGRRETHRKHYFNNSSAGPEPSPR